MKKLITFSLYGQQPKYSYGTICNVEIAKTIYPDWICRIYYGNSVSNEIIDKLKKLSAGYFPTKKESSLKSMKKRLKHLSERY